MNTQDRITPAHRPQRRILVALLACMAMLGALLAWLKAAGMEETDAIRIGSTLVFTTLIFCLYWYDSEHHAYKRTPLLNIAVIAIAILAIPYYLIRSRPAGRRLVAIGKLIGFMALMLAALISGGIVTMLLISSF